MKNKDNDKQELTSTDKNSTSEKQTVATENDRGADELRTETDAEGNDIVGSGLGIDE